MMLKPLSFIVHSYRASARSKLVAIPQYQGGDKLPCATCESQGDGRSFDGTSFLAFVARVF
jgi:hypothetical protein